MQNGNRRIQRVEREIKELVSSYMVYNISSEMDGLPSVSRVIVSRDLRTAKVLVYNQGGELLQKQNIEVLSLYTAQIQHYISSRLRMKYCPKVIFISDVKYEEALKVQLEIRRLSLERIQAQEA